MGVIFTDKDQNSISLMNVSYYDSKAEYMTNTFADVTDESAAEDFEHSLDLGYIQDITCGTYNGASQTFTPWQINDNNILDTIFNAIHEYDFIEVFSGLMEGTEDVSRWTNADWIREYTEVYEVFIIGDRVYVNKD